jgi:hypothetical protein
MWGNAVGAQRGRKDCNGIREGTYDMHLLPKSRVV